MIHLADFTDPEKAASAITYVMAELERAPALRRSAVTSAQQHAVR
ncbi:hypothetical protein [uncultured Roseibium sp.]